MIDMVLNAYLEPIPQLWSKSCPNLFSYLIDTFGVIFFACGKGRLKNKLHKTNFETFVALCRSALKMSRIGKKVIIAWHNTSFISSQVYSSHWLLGRWKLACNARILKNGLIVKYQTYSSSKKQLSNFLAWMKVTNCFHCRYYPTKRKSQRKGSGL